MRNHRWHSLPSFGAPLALVVVSLTLVVGCRRGGAAAEEGAAKESKLVLNRPPCCSNRAVATDAANTEATTPSLIDSVKEVSSEASSSGSTSGLGVVKQAPCCEGNSCPSDGADSCCDTSRPEKPVAAEHPSPASATASTAVAGSEGATQKDDSQEKREEKQVRKLFDGRTLKGWKKTPFGGEGEVKVEEGMIVMEIGNDMTGITFDGQPPTENYELSFRAQRLDGDDFFASATFPIGKEHCTLVIGGWGGTVVGISCIDGYDASDNTTTRTMTFKNKQWYDVRIRVSPKKLEAWIDGEQVVDFPRGDHKFSTRFECDPCRPLGFATWRTKGAVKDIEIRELLKEEIERIAEED